MAYSADEIFAMVQHDKSTNHILDSHKRAAEELGSSLVERADGLRNPRFDVETMLAQGQFGDALGAEIKTLLTIAEANTAQIEELRAGIERVSNRVDESYDLIAARKEEYDSAADDPDQQKLIEQAMLQEYGATYDAHVADANAIPEIPAYSGPREPVEIDWPPARPTPPQPPPYGPGAPTTPGLDPTEPQSMVRPPPPDSGAPVLQSTPQPVAPVNPVAPVQPVGPPVGTAPPPVMVPPPGTVPPVIGSRPTPGPQVRPTPTPRPNGTVRPVIGNRPQGGTTPRLPGGANSGGNPPRTGRVGGTPPGRTPGAPGGAKTQPTGTGRGGGPIGSRQNRGAAPRQPGVRIARQWTGNGGAPQARGAGLGQGRAMPRGPQGLTSSVLGRSAKSADATGKGAPGVRSPGAKPMRTGPVIGRSPAKTPVKRIDDKEPPKGSDHLEEWVDLPTAGPGVIRATGRPESTTDTSPVLFGRRRRSAEADDPENW